MPQTIFEAAGGRPALLALSTAFHERCLADPELNHPFSHPDLNPHHSERLAAYWAEVLGGPDVFSRTCGDHAAVLRMHAGHGDMSDLGRRFVDCFLAAMDDVPLPDDPRLRGALEDYMRWAVADVLAHGQVGSVPEHAQVPHWTWGGLAERA